MWVPEADLRSSGIIFPNKALQDLKVIFHFHQHDHAKLEVFIRVPAFPVLVSGRRTVGQVSPNSSLDKNTSMVHY